MSIGGIQTYLTNLIPVLRRQGYDVTIWQRSAKDFHKVLDGCDVYGIPFRENWGKRVAKFLLDAALPHIDLPNDLLLYGCETCITRHVPCRTVAIQHGIFWDVPKKEGAYLRGYVRKCLNAWKIIKRVSKVDHLVCVDNNFINWHRAITPYPKVKHIFIPNFTAIPSEMPSKEHEGISIIFARRFFPHRGTRLFANVIERILKEYKNIHVTVAGTGPDADYWFGRHVALSLGGNGVELCRGLHKCWRHDKYRSQRLQWFDDKPRRGRALRCASNFNRGRFSEGKASVECIHLCEGSFLAETLAGLLGKGD